jgi:hypothetical protein
MKTLFAVVASLLSVVASAQYYYKDIIGTKESSDLISVYRKNNVQSVSLKSYTIDNTPIENLSVQQAFSPATQTLRTVTKSDYLPASFLTTYFDENGRVLKTTDSTAGGAVNTTVYTYTTAGLVSSIATTFGDSLASLKSDEHRWQFDAQGRVSRMLRIRNGKDTSVINFKQDNAGNVIEEQETVRFIKEEPVYYFYDAKNRLTDIVRYNKKAARLLPEQMFEYTANNVLVQRTTIPQNSDNYLVWRYRFDDKGLKTAEEVFNKQKELTGKVEYIYTFSK